MIKSPACKFMLCLLLLTPFVSADRAFAQPSAPAPVTGTDPQPINPNVTGTDPQPINPSVTGTDPQPINPSLISALLSILLG